MVEIQVTAEGGNGYRVELRERGHSTVHRVFVSPDDVERYAPEVEPETLVRASFEFLLSREPKERILRSFELPAIESYFSDYAEVIRSRFQADEFD